MKENVIKVSLSEDNSVKNWEQPCQSDLPALVQAIRQVKVSVNDYLTELIDQQKGSVVSEPTENSELEEIKEDDISGYIKSVTSLNEKPKRKSNHLNQAKKVRK